MESHRRGDLTEQIVITELKRRDIGVSTPVGDNERYDLVVECPSGDLLRVQIKTGWLRDGVIRFKGISQHTNASGHVYERYGSDVDCFIVYCYDTDEIYLIDASEVGISMSLRVDDTSHETTQINWASDYQFNAQWPLDQTDALEPPVSTVIRRIQQTEVDLFTDPAGTKSVFLCKRKSDDNLRRVQVETGWVVDDRVRFSASSPADYHVVYCAELDELFAVHSEEFDDSISFRVGENERRTSRTNSANEYLFENNWPPEIDPGSIDIVSHLVAELNADGYDPTVASECDDERTLVVLHDGTEYRLRCEPAWLNNGLLRFDAGGCRIDYYIVSHPKSERMYAIPSESFDESISLRVEPPEKPDPRINIAGEFRFADRWPP